MKLLVLNNIPIISSFFLTERKVRIFQGSSSFTRFLSQLMHMYMEILNNDIKVLQ